MRKGQIAGQIFIYIIAIVVVGFIVLYGYSAIKDFSERGEAVEYLTLQKSVENEISSIVSDYGSIKRPDFSVPGKYEMVCFVKSKGDDLSVEGIDDTAICNPGADIGPAGEEGKYYQPIMCSGWKTGRSNVFLIPDGSESFEVPAELVIDDSVITSSHKFICLDVIDNKINLQLEGLGDRVSLSTYER